MGKARLVLLHEISIPRLEITVVVISVRFSKIMRQELDMIIQRVCYWTDSMSVLKCIKNESKRFHTFASNHLTVICNGSSLSEWHYMNRDDNSADEGSKGLKLDAMLKNNRWLKEPKFIWKSESHWLRMIKIPAFKDDHPKARKKAKIYAAAVQNDVLESLVSSNPSVEVEYCCRIAATLQVVSSNEGLVD